MKTAETQALPAPPNLFAALITGFDTLTNQVGLIIFPVALDLFLWLGPRLSLAGLFRQLSENIEQLLKLELAGPLAAQLASQGQDLNAILELNRQFWQAAGERVNLFAVLRTIPVGIPSLMALRQPVDAPIGPLPVLEPASGVDAFFLWVILALVGMVLGAFYFQMVAQAALTGRAHPLLALRRLPRAAFQAIALALLWVSIAAAISLPLYCLLSVFMLGGLGTSPIIFFLIAGLLVWVFFPLVLSPHGIFVNGRGAWTSLREGVRITVRTFYQTAFFLLAAYILSEGLNLLWNMPEENSWFTAVGIAGHAFITTGLLAASFIYYREADRWVQRLHQQLKFTGTHRI